MATVRSIYTAETRDASSSPDAPAEELPVPNETSPLLQPRRAEGLKQNFSEQWHPARSAVAAFINKNAGMLSIVVSQFFFSAMNVSVKFLTSLSEPVPTLEVSRTRRG